MNDETFARALRAHVDRVAPGIDVDTGAVLPRARRVRTRRVVGAGVASVLAVTLVGGWVASAQPWRSGPVEVVPAGPTERGRGAVVNEAPTLSPRPTVDPAAVAGWPDAAYWYVQLEQQRIEDDGEVTVETRERWLARQDEPGRAGWLGGTFVVDGAEVPVTWDRIGELPTDPGDLERVLRDTVTALDPDSTDVAARVFAEARDLLVGSPAPTGLRDALWEVMARQPGATRTPAVVDSVGRPGERVERGRGVTRAEVVYDPVGHRVLEVVSGWPSDPEAFDPAEEGYSPARELYLEEGPADAAPSPDPWPCEDVRGC